MLPHALRKSRGPSWPSPHRVPSQATLPHVPNTGPCGCSSSQRSLSYVEAFSQPAMFLSLGGAHTHLWVSAQMSLLQKHIPQQSYLIQISTPPLLLQRALHSFCSSSLSDLISVDLLSFCLHLSSLGNKIHRLGNMPLKFITTSLAHRPIPLINSKIEIYNYY